MDLQRRIIELGIRPLIGDHFVLMNEIELKALERQLKVGLPETYRWFLMTYGAASFEHSIAFHAAQPLPREISSDGDGPFSFFYGPDSDEHDVYSLKWNIGVLKDRMPESLIPIGGNILGNAICLGIRGAEAGKIYYWDHEREENEDDYLAAGLPVPPNVRFRNVHLIANSFEDFIHRLYVYVDEEA